MPVREGSIACTAEVSVPWQVCSQMAPFSRKAVLPSFGLADFLQQQDFFVRQQDRVCADARGSNSCTSGNTKTAIITHAAKKRGKVRRRRCSKRIIAAASIPALEKAGYPRFEGFTCQPHAKIVQLFGNGNTEPHSANSMKPAVS